MREGELRMSSAENALLVIQLMSQRGQLSVREVANELAVADSTAHRLLAACRRLGFVRQEAVGGAYFAGPALHEMALAASGAPRLREASGVLAQQAARDLGETVSIAILEGRQCRFVESFEGNRAIRVSSLLGQLLPAHACSAGRAILARLSSDDVARRFPTRTLEKRTDRTISDWTAFTAELDRTRKRGWAVEFGELEAGIASVSHVLTDSTGQPKAAMCVSAPMSRLTTAKDAIPLAHALGSVAAEVQSQLRAITMAAQR
ncbi:IclR family transcriptional regulator [Salinibacterium sp. dk2585]|nr:IclR family transcriptional regulator [Salinibacterium sp. dk2585]TXK55444.1 IclR family transcriptional regulator [Salinibacterium sp. dk5596]